MPKTKSTITAQFTTKIGKTPIIINLPVDLASALSEGRDPDASMDVLSELAAEQLQNLAGSAQLKLKNKAEYKRVFKAFAKANPPADA